jgi:hypothetical protein
MVVIILIMGIVLAFGVPTLRGLGETNRLRGATENMAAQIRLARERAIGTGVEQRFVFALDSFNSDYRIHMPGVLVGWNLPRGIVYDETPADDLDTLRLYRNGQASNAGTIVLMDTRGNRDTINVQISGLILTY